MIIYFFVEFLIGSGVTVVYSKEEITSDFYFNLTGRLFAFYLTDLVTNSINSRLGTISAVLWNYSGMKSTIIPLEMEKCQFGRHFSEEEYGTFFHNMDVEDFFCVAPYHNISLFFRESDWSGQYIIVYLRTCTNTTENNSCYPQEEINKRMTNTSYYFAYMLDTISIDHYNQSNPVNTASFFQQRKISFEARSDLDIAWKPVEYKTDVGWITESIIQDLYYQLNENLIQQQTTSSNTHYYYPNTYSKIQFGLHYTSIDRYKRSYPKIQSLDIQ